MKKINEKEINPSAIALDNILMAMENVYFGRDASKRIVGGLKKLQNLIASGKIRAEKTGPRQNARWKCNAADVLRNCRNMRKAKQ